VFIYSHYFKKAIAHLNSYLRKIKE